MRCFTFKNYSEAESTVNTNISFNSMDVTDLATQYLLIKLQPNLVCIFSFAGVTPVIFSDWEKIDGVEVRRGEAAGKPREKLLTVEEMLQVARK